MSSNAGRRIRRVLLLVGFCALVLLPHGFSSRFGKPPLCLGLPEVNIGDEPHYIIILNSLVTDGDLDLANDYQALHRKEYPPLPNRYFTINHHTTWFTGDGRHVYWCEEWDALVDRGVRVLKKDPNEYFPDPPAKEYSVHPPGMAFMLAPIAFPFRNTHWLQHVAILCAGVATILAMLAFASIMRCFTDNTKIVYLAMALTAFGTPVWHYGRTFYSEPFLMALLLGAMALHLRKNAVVLPAIFLSFCVLMKPPFIMVAAPIGLSLLYHKRWRDVILFSIPFIAVVAVLLMLNYHMFGHPLKGSIRPEFTFSLSGLVGILFNARIGIIPLSPLALVAFAGWPWLIRMNRSEATMILWAGLPYCLLMTVFWPTWHGGAVYGPRYVMPMLPFIYLGLAHVPSGRVARRIWWAAIVVLGSVSILINALGAVPYWRFIKCHPLFPGF